MAWVGLGPARPLVFITSVTAGFAYDAQANRAMIDNLEAPPSQDKEVTDFILQSHLAGHGELAEWWPNVNTVRNHHDRII